MLCLKKTNNKRISKNKTKVKSLRSSMKFSGVMATDQAIPVFKTTKKVFCENRLYKSSKTTNIY